MCDSDVSIFQTKLMILKYSKHIEVRIRVLFFDVKSEFLKVATFTEKKRVDKKVKTHFEI